MDDEKPPPEGATGQAKISSMISLGDIFFVLAETDDAALVGGGEKGFLGCSALSARTF